jgi:GT2 family glycosyltransferase
MQKVSVVIPVYNGWDLLKRNIESLIKYDVDNILEIIVVDDCSPQPNPYIFESSLVRIILNSSNVGYTGTVNNGLKLAASELIVLLDSDAYLKSPIIEHLQNIFKKDKTIGCVGFAAVGESGKPTGSFQFESTLLGLVLGQRLELMLGDLLFKKTKYILPLSCCVSFRKKCLQELNYFDAETFPVLEADGDLGMRIHRSSWKLEYSTDIVVVHEGGNSYKVNSKRVRMYHRAKWKLFEKHAIIRNPRLTKVLLLARIRVEIILLCFGNFTKKNLQFREKLEGRKLLFNDVWNY